MKAIASLKFYTTIQETALDIHDWAASCAARVRDRIYPAVVLSDEDSTMGTANGWGFLLAIIAGLAIWAAVLPALLALVMAR